VAKACPADCWCREYTYGTDFQHSELMPATGTHRPAVYLMGSLRNPRIPEIANELREAGWEVFDEWFAAGERADDAWQAYERGRGHTYQQALDGYAANHVFDYDKHHLDRCGIAVLVMPAGKSGCLELGYKLGKGCPGFILIEGEPERYDVMFKLATKVCFSINQLKGALIDYAQAKPA
jgi:hypothetical protein